jgi:hypothetical protein
MRRFHIWQESDTDKICVGVDAPETSPTLPDGSLREVVEMPLCKQGIRTYPLAELSVASSVSLDQILELLKRAPRSHSVDISGTKPYVEALARYSTSRVPTSNAYSLI